MLLKKILPTLLLAFCCLAATAQNEKVMEYINTYRELAMKEMLRTGVPAAITLAQGILESQSGESDLAKRSNNHFGIKCKTDWTGARVYHDDDARGECFRSYTDAGESYTDHSDFLKSRPHYAFLFTLDPTDYEGWARGLKKAGYATSPTYAQRLIDLIHRYDLQHYTLLALERSKAQQKEMFSFAKEEKTAAPAVETTDTIVVTDTTDTIVVTDTTDTVVVTDTTAAVAPAAPPETVQPEKEVKAEAVMVRYKASDYPESVFTINSTRVLLAKEGTSLLALANQFGISYKKLLEFNDLDQSVTPDILGYDQLIFLSRKARKGSNDFHLVAPAETMEIIAQKEGVQLEALLEYNRIPRGRQPQVGEKIYLKTNSPVTPKLVASTANN